MKDISRRIKKDIEKRARIIFPSPARIVLETNDVLTLVSGVITIINNNSFANIERDMYHFPILNGIDFRFMPRNPNRKYRLVKGSYETSKIEARLITDGTEISDTMSSFGRNIITNPLNPERNITLEESMLEEVGIEGSTFAIEKFLVDGRTEFLRFISEINDREELMRIAKFITLEHSQDNVQVLTLKNKMI